MTPDDLDGTGITEVRRDDDGDPNLAPLDELAHDPAHIVCYGEEWGVGALFLEASEAGQVFDIDYLVRALPALKFGGATRVQLAIHEDRDGPIAFRGIERGPLGENHLTGHYAAVAPILGIDVPMAPGYGDQDGDQQ